MLTINDECRIGLVHVSLSIVYEHYKAQYLSTYRYESKITTLLKTK